MFTSYSHELILCYYATVVHAAVSTDCADNTIPLLLYRGHYLATAAGIFAYLVVMPTRHNIYFENKFPLVPNLHHHTY
jgi:hypothetical protein